MKPCSTFKVQRSTRLSFMLGTLCSALAFSCPAADMDIQVRTEVSPSEATVGDRVTLEIAFRAPPAVKFEHVISGTSFADWDLVNISSRPGDSPDGDLAETVFSVILIPWSATITATPPFNFNAIQPPGRVEAVRVPPAKIAMRSVLAKAEDRSDLRPLKGAIGFRSWWPWIIGALVVAAAVLAWWLWRRRKRIKAAALAPPVPAVPPEITAREALDELAASGLIEAGDVKLFYSRLSDIFRRYVEGRFRVPALDRTTAELLPELRAREQLRGLYPEIRLLLESCDLVKFAKYVPAAADIESDVLRVRGFVDNTASIDVAGSRSPRIRGAAENGTNAERCPGPF